MTKQVTFFSFIATIYGLFLLIQGDITNGLLALILGEVIEFK